MVSSIVSNLIAADALDGAELYYGVQGSADRKVTGAQIKTLTSDSPILITPMVVTSLTGSGGGDLALSAGAAVSATAIGPALTVTAGDGGATSGDGGAVTFVSGNAQDSGYGGNLTFSAGHGGLVTGGGGSFLMQAGDAFTDGYGGYFQMQGGGAVGDNNGGGVECDGGPGSGSGAGGDFQVFMGDGGATGRGGNLVLTAGNGGGTSGNGGNITLTPGTVTSGTKGHIKLAGVENFADDAAAATGGVPVTGVYRTASVLKIRVA